jgi:uracil-DNA glycosylase
MRRALDAIAAELRRLKDEGVSSVSVSEAGMESLRAAVRRGAPPRAKAAVQASAEAKAPAFPPAPVFTLPEGDKRTRWEALKARVVADPVCASHVRPGKKVVLGVGNLDAHIMFIGEAPGADEEVQGEPFVGPAGQLLNRMIAATGLSRAEVYIGNIMNWRPEMPTGGEGVQHGNRPPTAEEMAYCMPYLRAQIGVVAPRILVALGATAAQGLLGPGTFKALGEVRGQWRDHGGIPLMITYHPSYILRNPTNRSKRMIWEDFLKVMEKAGLPISDKQRGFFL